MKLTPKSSFKGKNFQRPIKFSTSPKHGQAVSMFWGSPRKMYFEMRYSSSITNVRFKFEWTWVPPIVRSYRNLGGFWHDTLRGPPKHGQAVPMFWGSLQKCTLRWGTQVLSLIGPNLSKHECYPLSEAVGTLLIGPINYVIKTKMCYSGQQVFSILYLDKSLYFSWASFPPDISFNLFTCFYKT